MKPWFKPWFKKARKLGTNMIQIPANFLANKEKSVDTDVVLNDQRKVAAMELKGSTAIKSAQENLCSSTYVDTWGWNIVKRFERDNCGVCLNIFDTSIWKGEWQPRISL
ncbi:hypothetical protein QTJ16_002579 [Diplocarpon rosae]|uniref:Uncharacterized protein n=1 Tax=Diplocarpon rosae TaxID=946125 RepID=A0AAD9WF55_9HELO|nr:hypothetical protein QTJ16_002579 [Diplocarpon rosae]